jgi:trehalose synthase
MIELVDIDASTTLDDYEAYSALTRPVQDLREAAGPLGDRLGDRTVWMVNSTAQGGGVAEMLPKVVAMLRELGVDTEWAVIDPPEQDAFFPLTKRIHNSLHGAGDTAFTRDDRTLYESVSERLADAFTDYIDPGDILVVHDPQPLGMGALVADRLDVPAVWRCHIGLDRTTPSTEAAWDFLEPWTQSYDRTVFSLDDYVPSFLEDTSDIIHPAIDPLTPKNRELSAYELTGVLRRASMALPLHPTLAPAYSEPAKRLQSDDTFAPVVQSEDLGLLHRPIITQVSRWDRLKGFGPLLRGFARLKRRMFNGKRRHDDRHRMRLSLSRLVLAGPDPSSVADDPEGQEVFQQICALWHDLEPELKRDIAIVTLPMGSREINALMVNALQRCSTIIAQNSLQEGFGLTVTEGMWKGAPIMGTHAAGIQEQVNDHEQGLLLDDPEDPDAVADTLGAMLVDEEARKAWARNAQRRVTERYLVFTQVQRWMEVMADTTARHAATRTDGEARSNA